MSIIKPTTSIHKDRDEEWSPSGMFLVLQLQELMKKETFDLKDGKSWPLVTFNGMPQAAFSG